MTTSSPPRPAPAATRGPAPRGGPAAPLVTPLPPALLRWGPVALAAALLGLGWVACVRWVDHAPVLAPRHRPEALCFALAQPPPFTPPMTVEPSAALVRGRFAPATPPADALQQVMGFTDDMVVRRDRRRLGSYDVVTTWLRIPESGGSTHWLVLAWMEGSDLAVCNFRFGGRGPVISPDEFAWGDRLLARVLRPEYFRAEALPAVRMRAADGATMPRFGPPQG